MKRRICRSGARRRTKPAVTVTDARRMVAVYLLAAVAVPLLLLCIAPSAWGQATVIFADDFEAAFAGWTLSGTPDWYTGDPKNGTHGISLRKIESIQRTVSTACYQNITVSFYLGAKSLEGTETVRALWYEGGAWNVLKAIANGDPEEDGLLHYFAYALPPSAANNASFALRFEVNGSNPQDFGYVDDVVVLGDLIQYTLNLTGTGGSVTVNGTPQSLPWSGSFDCGSVVNLEAVPSACYEFNSWSGDLSGSVNPTNITMDANKAVTAGFGVLQYTLSLTGSGNGSVMVNGTPQSLPWSGSFDCGSVIALEAIPDSGWDFDGWTGDVIWSGTSVTVTVDASKNVTANFAEQPTLSLTKVGSGSVKVDGTLRALPWSGQFASGTEVALEAVPDSGWQFDGWSGDVTWAGAALTVTMDAGKNITANFSQILYTLTLAKAGNGSAKVDGTLRALPWSGQFASGTEVALEAVSDSGWQFDGWSGDVTWAGAMLTVTMDAGKSITANFSQGQYTLSLTKTGNGSAKVDGTLRTLPWSGQFASGSTVALEAIPDSGWQFDGWTGDITWSGALLTVTMDASKSITDNFTQPDSYRLTVSKTGSGSVTVNGASVSVPWSGDLAAGSEVTLEAAAAAGWEFDGWSGSITGSSNPITITMDSTKDVTANFSEVTYTVSLTGSGNGSVKVNETLYSLPWSGECAQGSLLTLEAVADQGWRFDGWSGDVSGTDNQITVTISGDRNITATFIIPSTYTLTLSKSGGPGSVKVNGTEQSLPWSGEFAPGTGVTIEAVADIEEDFLGWSGDLTGESNPVTITMDGDKSITANFVCMAIFEDVPCDYWCFDAVNAVYNAEIAAGYPDGYYRPEWPMDRVSMAVYIARALVGSGESVPEGPEEATFPDVPSDHWAFDSVEYVVSQGIAQGYGDGNYHPDWTVTRAQMSVFVARSIAEPTGEDGLADYLPPETPTFEDVPPSFWCYKHVEYLAQLGAISGYADGFYRPTWQVTRGQMAVYVARAFGLPM